MKKKTSPSPDRDLPKTVEVGEWKSGLTPSRRKELSGIAGATLARDARINLRLSSRDLELLKRQAIREGLPYQTYLASVLHKVATNQR